jgi:hypothetical protein
MQISFFILFRRQTHKKDFGFCDVNLNKRKNRPREEEDTRYCGFLFADEIVCNASSTFSHTCCAACALQQAFSVARHA